MSGWFCSSAFGPFPFSGATARRANGSAAGVVMSSRKNVSIANMTASAVVARRGMASVPRNAMKAVAPARIAVQRRIDPSRAAQRLMIE